ncbi:putative mitochondrial protein [Cucumis melo var. makuwa]|uniref:Mitochondrial protein n=1 Tax=Cucumis melo var. makuwa TaxID=1194695 RepID=A0A5A7TWG2_CUCMM|nr:putative mitochondrial protein [Cucumis melo var. makuwa]
MAFSLPSTHFVPLFELAAATSPLENFTPFSFRKKQPWPILHPLKPFQQPWRRFTHLSITVAADEDTVSTPLDKVTGRTLYTGESINSLYPIPTDPSLFIRSVGSSLTYLLLYVDNIIVTRPDYLYIFVLKNQLALEFKISDLGPLKYFLGLEIQSSIDGIFNNQAKYLNDLLHTSGMTSTKFCITPMSTSLDLYTIAPPFNDPSLYRRLVGSLQYLTFTHPNIAFSVNRVSSCINQLLFTFQPSNASSDISVILQPFGIKFRKSSFSLQTFCDSDWTCDTSDRRSTSGFIAFLGSNPISWYSKKQSTVSRSSTEAEYRSLATTTADLYWIRQLLCDLHVPLKTTPTLWCDNVFAISLVHNPVFHARTKHIEIDYHFVREKVFRKDISIRYISSNNQLVDILTKPLLSPTFLHLGDKLLTQPESSF